MFFVRYSIKIAKNLNQTHCTFLSWVISCGTGVDFFLSIPEPKAASFTVHARSRSTVSDSPDNESAYKKLALLTKS